MKQQERSKPLPIKLPPDAYEALQAIADKENRLMADIVRNALAPVFIAHGYDPALLKVNRGGDRTKGG